MNKLKVFNEKYVLKMHYIKVDGENEKKSLISKI